MFGHIRPGITFGSLLGRSAPESLVLTKKHFKSMKKLFRLMRSGPKNDHLRKIWMTMKLTLVLFFLAVSQMMATETYSQITKVSLHMKDAAVKEVLNKIEENSEFVFLYNSKLVNVDQKSKR